MTDWWQIFPQGRQTLTIEDAEGEKVAVAYGEAGTGQPLFLLHGIGSWSYSWRHNVKPLSQHFRVICPDAKGHGFSPASTAPETVGHQIVELTRIIQALTDQPAILVGESLGALTALAVAQAHPELIERLVLINVPIFPRQLPSLGMRSLADIPLDLVRWFDQSRLIRSFAPVVRSITWLMRQEVVADPNSITDEEIYWLTYPYVEFPGTITQFATDLQQSAREIRNLQTGQPSIIRTIQQDLAKVVCPTLILWGECDRWFPVADGEKLHAHLPNSQFQVIPNCGHNSSSSAAPVNEAILSFMQTEAATR
ncbi:alpha/beta hydrolase [Leptolyngbya sp. FACHB-541]|uniref:alpha/beta fold hydrolase n=1 Tax=Leptolyngbya sp. FACHB-541 TaxID=2692810 RepID=UPI001687A8BF|nr:alpha/beta hydrolase [Leptolyngbya sp. FACHB-541]MBD1999556.1 alpha/beta hydrolase [Leptolyngbya sp. FACHB-541]